MIFSVNRRAYVCRRRASGIGVRRAGRASFTSLGAGVTASGTFIFAGRSSGS